MRRWASLFVPVLVLSSSGCGSGQPSLPSSFDEVVSKLSKQQWAIEVNGLEAGKVDAVKTMLENFNGISASWNVVNPDGKYIVVRTANDLRDEAQQRKVIDSLCTKLTELALVPGRIKTKEQAPAPPPASGG